MWPFTSKKKQSPVPAVRAGDISVRWSAEFEWWEFSDGEFNYSLIDNPEFDVAILNKLGMVKHWLVDLNHEIDAEIKKNLEGWCEWAGEKHVVGIDVSGLISKQEIDVAYADGADWGDLGVNIVITEGKVTDSYAGD
jgi:hypothetical protein